MLRRSFRIGIIVGLLGGVIAAGFKAFSGARRSGQLPATEPAWTPLPDSEPLRTPAPVVTPPVEATPTPPPPPPPAPKPEPTVVAALQESPQEEPAPAPAKAPAKKKAPAAKKAAAKKATEPWVQPVDGDCPGTHPVKGKLSSKIFHIPGGFNYARTSPDRCYIDAAAAEADGLRQSKR